MYYISWYTKQAKQKNYKQKEVGRYLNFIEKKIFLVK